MGIEKQNRPHVFLKGVDLSLFLRYTLSVAGEGNGGLGSRLKMRWRSKKGFTLPEVMLATIIAAFAICGILLMYITAMDLIRSSKNVSIATSAAQGVIEEIRNFTVPFKCIPEDYGVPATMPACPVGGYNNCNFTVNNIPSSRGVVYVTDDSPVLGSLDLLRVTVSVNWRQPGRAVDSTVELVTQVASR